MVGFAGEILMNMLKVLLSLHSLKNLCLKMTIVPLIAASLVSGFQHHLAFYRFCLLLGLSQMDARSSGRIGMYAFLYYAVTMTLAVAVSTQFYSFEFY